MLHDIGKCKVPDAILNKPGPLDDEEWKVMRRHPEFGAEIVSKIEFLRGAADVVANHHEKYDGIGLPPRASRARRSRSPRASSWSWTRTTRSPASAPTRTPRRPSPRSPRSAAARARHFDPAVVEAFERIFPQAAADTIASMPTRRDATKKPVPA